MTRRLAAPVAVVAAGLGAVAVGTVGLALVGAAVLSFGAIAERRLGVDGGAALLAVAVALAGVAGGGTATVVAATAAAVVAWDAGRTAVDVGTTFDDAADVSGMERSHLGATTLVLGGAGVLALGVRFLGSGGRPVGALVVLGAGVLLVGAALAQGE